MEKIVSQTRVMRFSVHGSCHALFYLFYKGDHIMPNYEKLYHKLVRDVDKTIEDLKKAMESAENTYLEMCEKEFPNGEDLEDFEQDI